MNRSMLLLALFAALGLTACEKRTVVNEAPPPAPAVVPVPVPGPQGAPGPQGPAGPEGSPGTSPSQSSTVNVMPPASAASN